MNPIWSAAADSASHASLMGLATVTFLWVFVAWTLWAWAPSNREKLAAAALLPFDDDEELP